MLKKGLFALIFFLFFSQIKADLHDKDIQILQTIQRYQDLNAELKPVIEAKEAYRDSAWLKTRNAFQIGAISAILFSVTKLIIDNDKYVSLKNTPALVIAIIASVLFGHEALNGLNDYQGFIRQCAKYNNISIELKDAQMRLELAEKQDPGFEKLFAAVKKEEALLSQKEAAAAGDLHEHVSPQA